jgi:hypothetical protein
MRGLEVAGRAVASAVAFRGQKAAAVHIAATASGTPSNQITSSFMRRR